MRAICIIPIMYLDHRAKSNYIALLKATLKYMLRSSKLGSFQRMLFSLPVLVTALFAWTWCEARYAVSWANTHRIEDIRMLHLKNIEMIRIPFVMQLVILGLVESPKSALKCVADSYQNKLLLLRNLYKISGINRYTPKCAAGSCKLLLSLLFRWVKSRCYGDRIRAPMH
jgi:hypothetical protein